MDPPSIARRPILPKAQLPGLGLQRPTDQPFTTPIMPVPPTTRQPKSGIKTDQEWEHQKPCFLRLYIEEDLPLQEVIKRMEEDYHFKASRKQYNTKIVQWRVAKNVKEHEMKAISRKKRERKMQIPPKDSDFRIRKHHVNPNKIERFEKDHGIDDDDVIMRDAATPSDISCDTPRPVGNEILAQSAITISNNASRNTISPVQSMVSYSPYFNVLSPRLQVASSSYCFGQLSPNEAFPANSPHLSYPFHTQNLLSNNSPVNRSHLSHWSPSSTSSHGLHSPLRTLAKSAPIPSSSISSHTAPSNSFDLSVSQISNNVQPELSKLDWSESSINHHNRLRSLSSQLVDSSVDHRIVDIVRAADIYQAQRAHEVSCLIWPAFKALVRYRVYHYKALPCNIDGNFPVSETLQAGLPVLDFDREETLYFATSGSCILAHEERYRGTEDVIEATFHDMGRQSAWKPVNKGIASPVPADIYILCPRLDRAEEIVREVLDNKFWVVSTMAANLKAKFTVSTYIDGTLKYVSGTEYNLGDSGATMERLHVYTGHVLHHLNKQGLPWQRITQIWTKLDGVSSSLKSLMITRMCS